jgi:hypothetical protein
LSAGRSDSWARNGFGVFAWYRIALGLLMPGVLAVR